MSLRAFIKPCCGAEQIAFLSEKEEKLKTCSCSQPIEWAMLPLAPTIIHSTTSIHSVPLFDSFTTMYDLERTLTAEAWRDYQLKQLGEARLKS